MWFYVCIVDESAEFLAKLARKEIEAGHGIPKLSQDWSDEVEGVC